eukprot:16451282-Heterocapsa_arctica.AAC.1
MAEREALRKKAPAHQKFVKDKQELTESLAAIEKEEKYRQFQRDEKEARRLQFEEDERAAIQLEQEERAQIGKPAGGSNDPPV